MPRTNSRAAACDCGTDVAANAGYIYRTGSGSRWQVSCRSSACLDAHGIVLADERPRLDEQGRCFFPYDRAAVAIIKALPWTCRSWDRASSCWDLSKGLLQPRFRAQVLDAVERIGCEVHPSWTEASDDPTPELVEAALERARQGNAEGLKAFSYQLDGVRWLAEHPRALMGDDMGLGKTAQTLWALPEGARCLVVAPASLKLTWSTEVAKWRPDLTARVVDGRQRDCTSIYPAEGEVVVINYDILPTPKSIVLDGSDWAEVTLVTDEAHNVKSYKAARSQKVKALAPRCGRVWAITGTPLLGRPLDLWGVLSAHDMSSDVFGGWHQFLRVFGGRKGRWGGYEFDRTPSGEAPTLMKRIMIRRLKETVWADMPSRRYELRHVPVEGELVHLMDAIYDGVEEGLLKGLLPEFDEMSTVRADLARQRIPALVELVQSYEEVEEPIVVFSAYREPVLELGRREGWAVITGSTPQADRQEAVEAFQAGRLKGIAGTIAAMGVGLTLTRASTMIFNDLDWTPALNRQAEDRINRISQTASSCRYVKLVSAHPLDLRVMEVLERKSALCDATLDAEGAPLQRADIAWEAPQVIEETAAEREARVAAYEATKSAAERAAGDRKLLRVKWDDLSEAKRTRRARKTVQGSAASWLASYGARRGRPDVVIEDAERDLLREALASMLGACDGAKDRDGEGFSRSDVMVSRNLHYDGLSSDTAALAAWSLLRGYRRQLEGRYPRLFSGYRLVDVEESE